MKWFTISIHADGHRPGKVYTKEKPLTSFWDDKLHIDNSFAVLGFHVYTFGGQAIPMCLFDVCKFDVTRHGSYGFDPVSPMISPKFRLRHFVLDGKIYVFSCHQDYLLDANIQATLQWDEVFDVDNGKWKALLDPPHDDLSFTVISAALENPNMILVAFPVLNESLDVITFYTYNVQDQSWKMIAPAERKLHRKCPRGSLQKTMEDFRRTLIFTALELMFLLCPGRRDWAYCLRGNKYISWIAPLRFQIASYCLKSSKKNCQEQIWIEVRFCDPGQWYNQSLTSAEEVEKNVTIFAIK